MAELTGIPRCGDRDVHAPHYVARLDCQCAGWTPEQAGVDSLLRAVWGMRLSFVLGDEDGAKPRLVCHSSVWAAVMRNVMPSATDIQHGAVESGLGVPMAVDSTMAPGHWQLILAEGVIP